MAIAGSSFACNRHAASLSMTPVGGIFTFMGTPRLPDAANDRCNAT